MLGEGRKVGVFRVGRRKEREEGSSSLLGRRKEGGYNLGGEEKEGRKAHRERKACRGRGEDLARGRGGPCWRRVSKQSMENQLLMRGRKKNKRKAKWGDRKEGNVIIMTLRKG